MNHLSADAARDLYGVADQHAGLPPLTDDSGANQMQFNINPMALDDDNPMTGIDAAQRQGVQTASEECYYLSVILGC